MLNFSSPTLEFLPLAKHQKRHHVSPAATTPHWSCSLQQCCVFLYGRCNTVLGSNPSLVRMVPVPTYETMVVCNQMHFFGRPLKAAECCDGSPPLHMAPVPTPTNIAGPPEKKERKLWREREKSAKFRAPTPSGPHPFGPPTPSGPNLFGPQPFQAHLPRTRPPRQQQPPPQQHPNNTPQRTPHHPTKKQMAKCGLAKFGQIRLAKSGLANAVATCYAGQGARRGPSGIIRTLFFLFLRVTSRRGPFRKLSRKHAALVILPVGSSTPVSAHLLCFFVTLGLSTSLPCVSLSLFSPCRLWCPRVERSPQSKPVRHSHL